METSSPQGPVTSHEVRPVRVNAIDEELKFRRDFHIKEWESLRDEITSQIDHTRQLELATVAGMAAFYAWFATAKPPLSHFLLALPSLLVLLAGLRSWGTLVRIQEIATYIRKIEAEFCLNKAELIGWDRTRDRKFAKSSPFKVSAALFWCAALAVSVLAWFYL
jgi:hypothetical protein